MYCRECGSKINNSENICDNCGVITKIQNCRQVIVGFNIVCLTVIAILLIVMIFLYTAGTPPFVMAMLALLSSSIVAIIIFNRVWCVVYRKKVLNNFRK